jgi:GTP-binding protein Era
MIDKAGFVALVGLPNAGKSTLVNAVIGEKVGIVSRKPQTTRGRVIGIYNTENTQIAFVDSPGRVQAEQGLNHFLEKELISVVKDADGILCILNLDVPKKEILMDLAEWSSQQGKPWAIVINKTDLDNGNRETKLRTELLKYNVPVIAVRAIKMTETMKEAVLELAKAFCQKTESPLFDENIYTTQQMRDLAAEIVREECFEYLHQEIPYGLAVKVVKYDESSPTLTKIYVEILLAKENHLMMVLGNGGQMIKRIGSSSRIQLEKILGHKVFLDTRVKVKENWTRNPQIMKELGYVIPEQI